MTDGFFFLAVILFVFFVLVMGARDHAGLQQFLEPMLAREAPGREHRIPGGPPRVL
jgi:hypothetical protein